MTSRTLLAALCGILVAQRSPARADDDPPSQAFDGEDPKAKDVAAPPAPEPLAYPSRRHRPVTSPAPANGVPVTPEPLAMNAAYLTVGFGTPVGVAGFELVRRLGKYFELTGGLGYGANANLPQAQDLGIGSPLQWSLMPRIRQGSSRSSFTIGAGLSGGNYADVDRHLFDFNFENNDPPSPPMVRRMGYVLWANVEFGGEHWFSSGFAFRYFFGLANALNPGNMRCPTTDSCPAPFSYYVLPYAGLGFGYAF